MRRWLIGALKILLLLSFAVAWGVWFVSGVVADYRRSELPEELARNNRAMVKVNISPLDAPSR